MRSLDFHFRLLAATFSATHFAQSFVKDNLRLEPKYYVVLNASCDDHRKPDEEVFPEDDGRIEIDLSAREVVELLCRNEAVPQWIDIAVAFSTRSFTGLSLICCGRFHPDDHRLYYYWEGTQPFGIKSPTFPINFKEGQRFRLPSKDSFLQRLRSFYRVSEGTQP